MIHKSIWLALLVAFPVMAFAQKEREVSGEYTYYAPLNITPNEAKAVAIEKAKIQALADAFGTLIDVHSTSLVQNENGKSNTSFFSLGESSVKGEWLGNIREPETDVKIEGEDFMIVKAKVWGRAREIVSAPIEITAKLLKQTNGKHDEDQFHEGDNLYLSFKSPTKGYLAVYQMFGNGETYCLLPYSEDEDGQFLVKANKKYLLFSEAHAEKGEKCVEYEMTCEKETAEQNMVYVIFSPNKFTKANDDESNKIVSVNGKLESLPRFLSDDDFQKWLLRCRHKDTDMQVIIKPIVISK
jgi:hypothetical protein